MRSISPETRYLACMVRDNAVHGWRTLDEIATDEGLRACDVESACFEVLDREDLDSIEAFRHGNVVAAYDFYGDQV